MPHEPLGSRLPNRYKKTPTRGVLVYPLGLEPKLDSVGGCNVIQLHYEYVCFFLISTFFSKALIFYYFLLPFCKRLCYNIFKLKKFF